VFLGTFSGSVLIGIVVGLACALISFYAVKADTVLITVTSLTRDDILPAQAFRNLSLLFHRIMCNHSHGIYYLFLF
jgi:hypothetical protein